MKPCLSILKNNCLVSILILIFLNGNVNAQDSTQGQTKTSFIKMSLYPMFWAAAKNNLWLTGHFESTLKNKFSYNLVFDYYKWTYYQNLGYSFSASIEGNQIFYFRPQIRLYTGKIIYKGFYVGLFPLYSYQEIRYESKYANYFGLGAITGYQIFIKNKYPLEVNVWYATHTGRVNNYDYSTGTRYYDHELYQQLSFELNIGIPVKKMK